MVFAKKAEKQEEPVKEPATTAQTSTTTASENVNKPSVSTASNVQAPTIPATSAASNLGDGSELL